MKPIFCNDVTDDKGHEAVNGEKFIIQRVPKEMIYALDIAQEKLQDTIDQTKLPLPIRIIKGVAGALALIAIWIFCLSLEDGETFKDALERSQIIVGIALLCGLVWLVLVLVSKTKEKIVMQDQDIKGKMEQVDEKVNTLYDNLDVPKDAPHVDVLFFSYTLEDGVVVPQQGKFESAPFSVNIEMRAYIRDGMLCLSDWECVYAFKLEEMKAIKTIEKRIRMVSWNKDESIKSPSYKAYKLTEEDAGTVLVKPYYALEFEHEGEDFCIYFPCYDLPVFETLTGLAAE